jgi:hypothetical protein
MAFVLAHGAAAWNEGQDDDHVRGLHTKTVVADGATFAVGRSG